MKRRIKVPVLEFHLHPKHFEARAVIGMKSEKGHTQCFGPCLTHHLILHGKDSNQHSLFEAAHKRPPPTRPTAAVPTVVATAATVAAAVANATPASPLTAAADAVLTFIRMHRFVAVRSRLWHWRRCNLSLAVSMTPRSIPTKFAVIFPNDRNCGWVERPHCFLWGVRC